MSRTISSVQASAALRLHVRLLHLEYNIGALIIRIGFGPHYTATVIRNPHNSIGNY